ncbi:MAG: SsrA-binding protein SmpB [Acidobacteriota bacterium]
MAKKQADSWRNFATNRAARFHYHILERLEAGISLTGPEVKSVRDGKVVLKDAFATVTDGEVFLHKVHIASYVHAPTETQDPERRRKLLLHKREIAKLQKQTRQAGFTLVPTRLYLERGRIKCEIGVAKGKKLFDKRAAKKEESARHEIRAALARRRKLT